MKKYVFIIATIVFGIVYFKKYCSIRDKYIMDIVDVEFNK
ncbi:hypothetical protein ACUXJN_001797 [Staphylococcus capitis]|nr:hypothetical protein AYP1020_2357 [Staphylococcus capitis subsp. capitis]